MIKSTNATLRPGEAERLRLAAAEHPDVLLLEQYLDATDRDALTALCDCYVSLHRSEGLGLTMAEAIAWGKPAIATGYSGRLQFMTQENSFLVPWTPAAIPDGAEPYPLGGTWADPDLDAAAAAMRTVVHAPEVAAATSQPGASWGIASRHVTLSRVVPSALIGAVLVGAALLGWLLWVRTRRTAPTVEGAAGIRVEEMPTGLGAERVAMHALVPVVALALVAPVPYIVSALWVSQLVIFGTTYMHSLVVLWCWAMALALGAVQLVRSRAPAAWLVLAALVVTGWIGVQFSINRQLAAELTVHPTVGVDVAVALEHPAPREEDRCATLFAVRPRPDASLFISLLNREFEERYGEPFCTSATE